MQIVHITSVSVVVKIKLRPRNTLEYLSYHSYTRLPLDYKMEGKIQNMYNVVIQNFYTKKKAAEYPSAASNIQS